MVTPALSEDHITVVFVAILPMEFSHFVLHKALGDIALGATEGVHLYTHPIPNNI